MQHTFQKIQKLFSPHLISKRTTGFLIAIRAQNCVKMGYDSVEYDRG